MTNKEMINEIVRNITECAYDVSAEMGEADDYDVVMNYASDLSSLLDLLKKANELTVSEVE